MNLLKSLFMTGYMMLTLLISAYAGWMLYRSGMQMEWLGTLLTAAPSFLMLAMLMMFGSVKQANHYQFVLNSLAVLGLGLVAAQWVTANIDTEALFLSATGLLGTLLYAYWYSSFGRSDSVNLEIGAPLPEFTVLDAQRQPLSSKSFTGRPTILIFYRGNWCPFCSAQIQELAARFQELDALGVRVALISPQPYRKNAELARKFGVSFEFLTDEGNAAARILQIEDRYGVPMGMQAMGYDSHTVMPTVLITDRNNTVVWRHETDNYRIRPEPDVYLDVLRQRRLVNA